MITRGERKTLTCDKILYSEFFPESLTIIIGNKNTNHSTIEAPPTALLNLIILYIDVLDSTFLGSLVLETSTRSSVVLSVKRKARTRKIRALGKIPPILSPILLVVSHARKD
ncbi:MAG: hypothetical protein HZB12_02365 [Candidatus Yonathbacteria bacterium]|nr:hypothetical protein [Candidatus Yonathbacteria bacterium]